MNKELETYYLERFSMMATKGWADLIEDVQQMYDAANRLDGVTKDNFEFKKGELSIMRWVLSLKQASRDAYEGLKNESDV